MAESGPESTGPSGLRAEAPVVVRLEVEVDAPIRRIWELLVDVEHWYRSHPGMDFAKLKGDEFEPGVRLHWRADGMRISSVLHQVDAPHRVGWTLRTLGGRGYHRWTLEELGSARTLLRTEESWSGIFPFLLRGTLRKTLQASRTAWLEGFRSTAESLESQDPLESPDPFESQDP